MLNKIKKFNNLLEELRSKVINFGDYLLYDYPVYRIVYDYNIEYVAGEDSSAAVDNLIDYILNNGLKGHFIDIVEYCEGGVKDIEGDFYYPDTYIIGGNNGLALFHGGNFKIDRVL